MTYIRSYEDRMAAKATGRRLFIPVAPPGAGKTRHSHNLVLTGVLNEDALISSDHYREVLAGDESDQTCTAKVFRLIDIILDERFKRGLDVYMDATNLVQSNLVSLISRALDHNYVITILLFEYDESVIRERNLNRSRVVPEEAMDRMFARLQSLDIQGLVDTYGLEVEKVSG